MDEVLRQLEAMDSNALKNLWKDKYREEPPSTRATDQLRRRIAWRLQEEQFGGLDTETKRKLRDLAQAFERDERHKPSAQSKVHTGTVLTREWKGRTHTVQVTADGFIYNGKRYKGLSKIAREITGTRWSGPLFFGLRKTKSRVESAS